jgi:hypothetical protein
MRERNSSRAYEQALLIFKKTRNAGKSKKNVCEKRINAGKSIKSADIMSICVD